jgi:transcriptional regulator GlxA family with amidase domain
VDRNPLQVVVPVFGACDASIIYGIFDTLWAAGRLWSQLHGGAPGAPCFEPRLVGATAGQIELVNGVTIVLHAGIEDTGDPDIVFVPNVLVDGTDALASLEPTLLGWIREKYERGAQVYAACGGSLVLAAAGLLDDLDTTTHWAYERLLRTAFPRVRVHADRLLVPTGPGHRIVCCGGASSWQDLCLLLIARHVGPDEAIRVAKIFLYQWHQEGQSAYASLLCGVRNDDRVIDRLQHWIADNYHRRDVVCELTTLSKLPKRTLDRRFRRATGYAPLAYVQAMRIEEAKQMLETSDASIEAIAVEVGYEDVPHFRRLFRRLTGMRPSDYRKKFRIPPMPEVSSNGRGKGTRGSSSLTAATKRS